MCTTLIFSSQSCAQPYVAAILFIACCCCCDNGQHGDLIVDFAELKAVRDANETNAEQGDFLDDLVDEPDADEPDAQRLRRQLGKSTLKQWVAAAGFCQFIQQMLLYGVEKFMPICSEREITMELQLRTREENKRKNESFQDAHRLAPTMTSPEQLERLIDEFAGREGRRLQYTGLRNGAMYAYLLGSASRGQEPRNIRHCQQLHFELEAVPDVPGSQQAMQIVCYLKDIHKLADGERTDISAVGRHRDVRHWVLCIFR